MIEQARARIRRAGTRRQIQGVMRGKNRHVKVGLDDHEVDLSLLVSQAARRLADDSIEMQWLQYVFQLSGTAVAALNGLASKSVHTQARSVRMVGALRMEQAVPWVAMLLNSPEPVVADAAARALGRIGGWRSAQALSTAIQRIGPRRTLITALARSAPDLFVEAGLSGGQRPVVLNSMALAAGLRRRHTAVGPLLALLVSGNRHQRVVSCRSLGWIGARTAVPMVTAALADREWRVRVAAAKALGAFRTARSKAEIEALLADRNPRVRRAAQQALRMLEGR